ncbi:stabilization of polarity axis-domain-containing protein [Mycotypha africana]|uniref:stabilization of polarity axis-domain-containing protein n=1 Tax=Mycotypha africana TaxID=64632 RepID=UPI002300AB62|nr:stabilization of polarity axis-domain-containing protein [Mycotypha africana]KAI8987406.1 stabilization of polarity axis-domain-containing protein [Mycotypha africana]
MLPDGAHLRAEDWTIFCLNQLTPELKEAAAEECQPQQNLTETNNMIDKPLLYVLNLVRTKHDSTARRGARVKALAICTRHQYLHIYKPVLLLAMEKYFENPTIEILESLYKAVNSMDLSRMPLLTWHERQILRATDNRTMFEELFLADRPNDSNNGTIPISTSNNTLTDSNVASQSANIENGNNAEENRLRRGTYIDLASGHVREKIPALSKDTHFFETKIVYDGIHLPIRIPLTMNDEEVGDFSIIKLIHTFSPNLNGSHMNLGFNNDNKHAYFGSPNPHHPHLDSSGPYTHPIMILLNALLTQKRIIFLGYGHPSGEVANYVLAACALGSGCGTVLKGFTERAFPYTNLTSIDELLKCPGFIAGVTNPTYEEHTSWWDVLCDISTGKITVSDQIEPIGRNQSSITMASSTLTAPAAASIKPEEKLSTTPPITGFHALSIGRSSSLPHAMTTHTVVNTASSPSSSSSHGLSETKTNIPITSTALNAVDNTDAEFINDVMVSIQAHYGETSIRAKFQDYVLRFVRLAAVYEEQVYGYTNIGGLLWSTTGDHFNNTDSVANKERLSTTSISSSSTINTTITTTMAVGLGYGPVFQDESIKQRELNANRHRIEGWRQTISYQYYQRDIKPWINKNSCIQGLDVYRQISKLKKFKSIPDSEMSLIYEAFLSKVITHRQIIEV